MAAPMAAVVLAFGALAWWGAEGGQTSLFLAAAPFQTPSVQLVKQHPLSSDLGMLCWGWALSLSLLPLCSCHRISALASPVGCLAGMAHWGHSHRLLAVQATASRNLCNKPIKSQAGLEPAAAWGSRQVNPELLRPRHRPL